MRTTTDFTYDFGIQWVRKRDRLVASCGCEQRNDDKVVPCTMHKAYWEGSSF